MVFPFYICLGFSNAVYSIVSAWCLGHTFSLHINIVLCFFVVFLCVLVMLSLINFAGTLSAGKIVTYASVSAQFHFFFLIRPVWHLQFFGWNTYCDKDYFFLLHEFEFLEIIAKSQLVHAAILIVFRYKYSFVLKNTGFKKKKKHCLL